MLEQETAFDSLQWFEAVGAHYTAEAAAVAERPAPDAAAPSLASRFLDGLSSLRGAQAAAPWLWALEAAPVAASRFLSRREATAGVLLAAVQYRVMFSRLRLHYY